MTLAKQMGLSQNVLNVLFISLYKYYTHLHIYIFLNLNNCGQL